MAPAHLPQIYIERGFIAKNSRIAYANNTCVTSRKPRFTQAFRAKDYVPGFTGSCFARGGTPRTGRQGRLPRYSSVSMIETALL
jgi:hypothetical protein